MPEERDRSPGFVSLVGAGPGDPGLLTLRGRRALERADVVLYDHLASPALLATVVVPGQERIHVGKTAGAGRSQQADINALLVRRARAGDRVCRLKGGDPMIYGRGGEEAQACADAHVAFEIIPGVSALSAVPAWAGMPLTHRDVASTFMVATGHEREDAVGQRVDWRKLAAFPGTLVTFMGVLQIRRWAAELVDGGRDADTPVALVRWGTTPRQDVLEATLGTVADAVDARGFRPPALALIGDVVRFRSQLDWRARLPLASMVIGVTRSSRRDLATFEPLEDLGATVVHLPLTHQTPVGEGRPLAKALQAGGYSDLVVTSANGVTELARGLALAGMDARDLHGVSTWAVGPATAAHLRASVGVHADHVPVTASGEGLVTLARDVDVQGRRFLFPAAQEARDVVPRGLTALGAEVHEVAAYRTEVDPLGPARLESALEQGLSWVALASPSAVGALADALSSLKRPAAAVQLAVIGPTTAEAARRRGLSVALVARIHTMAGLVDAIAAHARSTHPGG